MTKPAGSHEDITMWDGYLSYTIRSYSGDPLCETRVDTVFKSKAEAEAVFNRPLSDGEYDRRLYSFDGRSHLLHFQKTLAFCFDQACGQS